MARACNAIEVRLTRQTLKAMRRRAMAVLPSALTAVVKAENAQAC